MFVAKNANPMKYNVFISYSREDYYKDDGRTIIPGSVVSQIVEVLNKYKKYYDFEYFFDQEAITSRQDYLKRISAAIAKSEVMFFVASKNSYKSEFCTKELLFADKRDVRIHQYCIDDAVMPDDIDMLLGNHHYREYKTYSVEKMVCEVLSDALQCTIKPLKDLVQSSVSNKAQNVKYYHEETARIPVRPVSAAKTYKVGDLYDENGKRGVVFEVSADGKHGKIVSFNETKLKWANSEFDSWEEEIGADSETNGAVNMAVVQCIPNWREKYPAFAWCADLGEGWYLPAINELKAIYSIRNILNDKYWYWSSTENKECEFCAWYV